MPEFKLKNFNLQLCGAISLPEQPQGANATAGKDYLIYVAAIVSPATTETWELIGGQRSLTVDESAEEIDISSKTTGGYKATMAGLTSWSVDFDALNLLPGSDNGVAALKIAKAQNKLVKTKIRNPDNSYRVGWAASTGYSVEAGYDGEATLSGTLNGNGPLSNDSVTVSKADPEDQTFYFNGMASVTKITLAGATVAAENYTATKKGEVTIKETYFATLEKGEHLFYAHLSIGGYALLAVDIEE